MAQENSYYIYIYIYALTSDREGTAASRGWKRRQQRVVGIKTYKTFRSPD